MILSFEIPGEPDYARRAKARKFGNKAMVYNPAENVSAAKIIRDYAVEAMRGRPPIKGAVRLSVVAFYSYPASWSKKQRERSGGWKTTKPDTDNIVKLYKDAFNGIVWVDDRQVAIENVTKVYTEFWAHTFIDVDELDCSEFFLKYRPPRVGEPAGC